MACQVRCGSTRTPLFPVSVLCNLCNNALKGPLLLLGRRRLEGGCGEAFRGGKSITHERCSVYDLAFLACWNRNSIGSKGARCFASPLHAVIRLDQSCRTFFQSRNRRPAKVAADMVHLGTCSSRKPTIDRRLCVDSQGCAEWLLTALNQELRAGRWHSARPPRLPTLRPRAARMTALSPLWRPA